jgi:outer membrane protein assembly factor BamB
MIFYNSNKIKKINPALFFCLVFVWTGCNIRPADSISASGTDSRIAAYKAPDSIFNGYLDSLPFSDLLQLKWEVKVSDRYLFAHPILINTELYALTDENIVVLDTLTGNKKRELALSGSYGTPLDISLSDSIILLHGDRGIVALSANDGKMIWECPLEWAPWPPVLYKDNIYVNTQGFLVSINIKSGKKTWSFKTTTASRDIAAVQNKMVFVAVDSNLYALNDINGEMSWKLHLDFPAASKPVIEGETIYIWTKGGKLYAIDLGSHEVIWSSVIKDNGYAVLFCSGDSLLVCGTGQNCFDRNNGSHLWNTNLESLSNSGEAMLDKYLFFNRTDRKSTRHLTAIDKYSGKKVYTAWNSDLDKVEFNFCSSFSGRIVYAAGSNGKIYAFEFKK